MQVEEAGSEESPARGLPGESRNSSRHVKSRLFSASFWSFIASAGGQISSFVIFAILAHLLEPRDFGLVAFFAVFIDLTRGVIVGGIPEALIQRPSWSIPAANTAFWLNIVSSLGFVALAAAAVLGLDRFGWAGTGGWIFLALSATLVLDAARGVHEAYLRRNFTYKLLAARTVIATLIGGVVGVAAAFAGFGVWALVISRVATSGLQTAILWRSCDYRPKFSFERSEMRPLLTFSSQVMLGRLIGQINGRLPDFVIGFVAGATALGLYRVGSRSLNFLVQTLIMPLQTTTLSAFSRLKDREAVARAYGRFTQVCAAVTFPAFLGSAAVAPDFVRVCFGPQWQDSAWIMAALSLIVFPHTLLYFFQPAMQAAGRPRRAIAPEAARLAGGAVIVTLASFVSPLAAALGNALRNYITLPQSLRILESEIGTRPMKLVRGVAMPLFCSLAMVGVLVAAQLTLLAHWNALPRLVFCVALGAGVYLGLLLIVGRRFVEEVLNSARHGMPARAQRAIDRFLALPLPGRALPAEAGPS